MKTIIWLTVLILSTTNIYAAENVFVVNKPLRQIVQESIDRFSNEKPVQGLSLKDIPQEILDVDSYFKFEGYPKQKYYKFTATLLSPIGKVNYFEKTLEIWDQDGRVVCKSKISIVYGHDHRFPLRFIDKIKQKIISAVEAEILSVEMDKIKSL